MTNSHKAFSPLFFRMVSVIETRANPKRLSVSKMRTYRNLRELGQPALRAFQLVKLSCR